MSMDARQRQLDSITDLKDEIRISIPYIEDPELKLEAIQWMQEAAVLPETDVMDFVENRLADLRSKTSVDDAHSETDGDSEGSDGESPGDSSAGSTEMPEAGIGDASQMASGGQYAMRRTHDSDGPEEFPDACSGCPHFGVMCPIFVDAEEVDQRRMIREKYEDASEADVKQQYRQLATYNNCHMIPQFLEEYDRDLGRVERRGWEIYEQIEVDVNELDAAELGAEVAQNVNVSGEGGS